MVRGFLVSAMRSGEGKTLLTLGILRLLKRRGFKVQPFKVGPDFIDPMWHKIASKVPSYNLDLFSMGEKRLKEFFYAKIRESNYAIIEGVMGLFDGKFSSYKVAKLLNIPVILVINAFGVSESIQYLIKGVSEKLKREGIPLYLILNSVSSEKHLLRLEKALKSYKILGILFKKKELELPSRHLGLFLPEDINTREEFLDELSFELEKNLKIDLMEEGKITPSTSFSLPTFLPPIPFKDIAIAYDGAFNFYYAHLLEELSSKATIHFFSPLRNEAIPSKAQAVFIGGGYPELWAERLAKNKKTILSLREWVESGLPLYAECGGLIYLSKELLWAEGSYRFSEILPYRIMKRGLTLGYRFVKPTKSIPLFETKTPFFAHEFHYTHLQDSQVKEKINKIFTVYPFDGTRNKIVKRMKYREGFLYKNCLATYLHLLSFASSSD